MRPETVLLRQVHPNFLSGGELTSQAFVPNSGDNNKLSVYDGDQITAEHSYTHYTVSQNKQSSGVWGLSCADVAAVGLTSAPDPLPHFPSHALVDFAACSEKQSRKLAKRLKSFAVARGCLYQPG